MIKFIEIFFDIFQILNGKRFEGNIGGKIKDSYRVNFKCRGKSCTYGRVVGRGGEGVERV